MAAGRGAPTARRGDAPEPRRAPIVAVWAAQGAMFGGRAMGAGLGGRASTRRPGSRSAGSGIRIDAEAMRPDGPSSTAPVRTGASPGSPTRAEPGARSRDPGAVEVQLRRIGLPGPPAHQFGQHRGLEEGPVGVGPTRQHPRQAGVGPVELRTLHQPGGGGGHQRGQQEHLVRDLGGLLTHFDRPAVEARPKARHS